MSDAPPPPEGETKQTEINGKVVDLTKIKSLTVGDLEWFTDLGLYDFETESLRAVGMKDVIKMIAYLAQKANPEVTEDDVRQVDVADLPALSRTFEQLAAKLNRKEADAPL